ncbi:MAG: hypothetical protein NC203_06215 [Firmicutes bacterium]|nr:hypothetical protein [[Eubacterium] siraeum]MCM1487940.1 hypothetical protein [Bacillota bacterium]
MKLSNKEKVILAVFLAVVIIVAGVFLLILPEYNKIDPNKNSLKNAQNQRDQINQTLLRESTIDQEIQTALDKANTFSENFYDDLTTYQADMILRDILAETDLEASTLTVSDFTTTNLTLTEYIDTVVTYPLKDFSGYVAPGLIDVSGYGIAYDEDGNITVPEGFTLEDTKELLKDYMRLLLQTQQQTIGSITVSFDVKGTRADFIKFLDYVAELKQATHIDSCVIGYSKVEGETTDEEGNAVGNNLNGTRMTEFGNANIVRFTDTSNLQSSVTITFYSVIPPQFGSETEAAEAAPAA